MRLLFYEPDHNGHHYPYLARMLPAFIEQGVEVVVATTAQGIASDEFKTHLAPLGVRVEPACELCEGKSPTKTALFRLREFRRVLARLKPDRAYVMYADGLWQLMAMLTVGPIGLGRFPVPVEGYTFRGGFVYDKTPGRPDRVKRRLFLKLLRLGLFDRLHMMDDLLFAWATEHASDAKTKLVLSPEGVPQATVPSVESSRAAFGIDPAATVIGTAGMIDERKGVVHLLKAYLVLANQAGDAAPVLLLAGPHQAQVKEQLARPEYRPLIEQSKIVSKDAFLDDTQMMQAVSACDLVVAAYPNHSGRSSILIWSAAAGRRVLGAKRGCIGHMVNANQLGGVVDPTETDAYAAKLQAILAEPWGEQDAQRAMDYAALHDVDHFKASASEGFRAALA